MQRDYCTQTIVFISNPLVLSQPQFVYAEIKESHFHGSRTIALDSQLLPLSTWSAFIMDCVQSSIKDGRCNPRQSFRAQELCESRVGRPGLPSLINLRFLWTESNTSTTSQAPASFVLSMQSVMQSLFITLVLLCLWSVKRKLSCGRT